MVGWSLFEVWRAALLIQQEWQEVGGQTAWGEEQWVWPWEVASG